MFDDFGFGLYGLTFGKAIIYNTLWLACSYTF